MRPVLAVAILLLMAVSAGAQAPPIRIGFASAMSGPAAITGEGVRWGATLAVEEINAKGGNEWTFRVALDDEIMAYTFAKYMARQGVKSSSILAMNNDFGRGAAIAYEAAFKKSGIKLLSTEFFDPGQPDYRPVLTRLRRANPDTILAVILASDGAPFMRQYRELGLTQKIFSRGSLASAEFLYQVRDHPKVGDGVVEAGYWLTGLDPDWD